MICNPITGFMVPFDIRDYADILPLPPERIEDIINHNMPIENCVWKRQEVDINNPQHIEREIERILRTGVWIFIKKQLIWLPPAYYFFLQYFSLSGKNAEFRLKRLMHVYFKLRVRKNKRAIGTFTMKNRQDGETSYAMCEALWECARGNIDFGGIGMQSKTRDTVIQSCWRIFIMGYNGLPTWLKGILYSDIVSEENVATKVKFMTPASETDQGRDILVTYGASSHKSFDSMNNMVRCILDEVAKGEECSFYATFLNYEKFIAPGTERKGIFDIFSSPSDVKHKYSDEAYIFWKGSDPNNLTEYGSTHTRVFRFYSDPRFGIEGRYDIWGDADADEILKSIYAKRASLPKDQLLGEVRAYPLNETEMFDSTDNNNTWSNGEGIKERMAFLVGRRFKSDETKEPLLLYGNLQWKNNIPDNPEGVVFRQADVGMFDLEKARFAISHIPKFNDELKWAWNSDANGMRPVPPRLSENIIGIDPFDKRYGIQGEKGLSNGSMVNVKYLDLDNSGIYKVPTVFYCCRPQHINTFFEDAIKLAVFMRAKIQLESKNSKAADYFEDRHYFDWLLAKRGEPENSKNKGDAPGSGGAFLNEMIALIDDVTNLPLTPEDPYLLDNIWFHDLLKDIMNLDPKNTQKSDGFNAWGQAMIGMTKVLQAPPPRKVEKFNRKILSFVSS